MGRDKNIKRLGEIEIDEQPIKTFKVNLSLLYKI